MSGKQRAKRDMKGVEVPLTASFTDHSREINLVSDHNRELSCRLSVLEMHDIIKMGMVWYMYIFTNVLYLYSSLGSIN